MSRSRQTMIKAMRPRCAWLPAVSGAALLAMFCVGRPCAAQAKTPILIDASQPYSEPEAARYNLGSEVSPSGRVLAVNSRYLTLAGKPWLPVMGEFHFSRFPESQWEEEILKMKAGGVNIVATYVIWIHHEEIEGQFDWQGQRNLRAFAQLCAKHHMYLLARIGPWAHGEVRNGGFPDWVLKKGPTRVNDPGYLSDVRRWYGQVGRQLNGLLWKDDGPVVGIQLENEYSQRGPGAGEEHILELKKIAIESGLDVPLYLVTGWDNAAVPAGAVIPVFGGYPDAPWDGSLGKLPPSEVYAFRLHNRAGADLNASPAAMSATRTRPFLTAEIGGGNEVTYHRRPVIQPDDIAAMFPTMLGSGVNLYGTYMFQGGENPDGKLTTLQESQATGYPNDVPIKSYDFQAPLGEFGEERASFRKVKVFQYFLNDFGADLAPMMVHVPDKLPNSPGDFSTARASVRSREDAGFIFFNNYVRGYSMPMRPAVQFEIQLPGGSIRVPRHPVDIPSGAYFIWPFNLRIGGVTLRYSTAQLFTRQESGGVTTLYFSAVPGVPAEFAFDASGIGSIHASSGEMAKDHGEIWVSVIKPGVESLIDVVSNKGEKLRFVVLSEQEAEDAWKVSIGGASHLLVSGADFFADPDTASGRIWLRSRGTREFAFAITPPLAAPLQASLPLTRTAGSSQADRFAAQAAARKPELHWRQIQAPGDAPPVKLGPAVSWRPRGVAQAPSQAELASTANWSITLPAHATDGLSGLYLQVNYHGDVARLYSAHRLLTDDFYNGQPWLIGLDRFLDRRGSNTFELSILPLRQDAPVYFEVPNPLSFAPNGQIDKLDGMSLIPEYQLTICTAAESSAQNSCGP